MSFSCSIVFATHAGLRSPLVQNVNQVMVDTDSTVLPLQNSCESSYKPFSKSETPVTPYAYCITSHEGIGRSLCKRTSSVPASSSSLGPSRPLYRNITPRTMAPTVRQSGQFVQSLDESETWESNGLPPPRPCPSPWDDGAADAVVVLCVNVLNDDVTTCELV